MQDMEKVTVNGRIFQMEKGTVLADVLREAGGLKMPAQGKESAANAESGRQGCSANRMKRK